MMEEINNSWGMGYGYIWLIGLILLILVSVLLINAVKNRKSSRSSKYNSPQEILKIRYAKGEISKGEYDEKWRHIS